MKWLPVAFLANGVLKVSHGGIELTSTVVLRVRMLNHYATVPFLYDITYISCLVIIRLAILYFGK